MAKTRIQIAEFDPFGPFGMFFLPPRLIQRQKETRFKQEWNVTGAQYNQLMNERYCVHSKRWMPLRKYQRGSVSVFAHGTIAAAGGGGGGGDVVLTNHTLSSTDLGALVTCRVRFNSDGTLEHDDDGTIVDVQSGEWHVDEPSATGADFEVRYLSVGDSGDAYTAPAAAADTWIRIDVVRSWGLNIFAKFAPLSKTHTSTFEIGAYLASSADDSGVITLNADN